MQLAEVDDFKVLAQQNVDCLVNAGFTNPVCRLTLADRTEIIKIVALHHALLQSKAELDQLVEGLSVNGVAGMLRDYPDLVKPFFTSSENQAISAGIISV